MQDLGHLAPIKVGLVDPVRPAPLVEAMAFAVLLILSLTTCVVPQRFTFSPHSRTPSMQVDQMGRVFISAGSTLYRLNANLELEDSRALTSEAVNISLSTDGRWLVVCLTDLSCEVYNATNLSAQPVFRRENVIRSSENVALFAAEDSFYVGSTFSENLQTRKRFNLGHYRIIDRFAANNSYLITVPNFVRSFFGGLVRGSNAYYFVVDHNPVVLRNIRVMRVCHNSNFSALYELTLGCGGIIPSVDTRISGISILDNFAGRTGPTVILSRSRPHSTQNYVCVYNLTDLDNIMEQKYNSCSSASDGTREQVDLAWKSSVIFCNKFLVSIVSCT